MRFKKLIITVLLLTSITNVFPVVAYADSSNVLNEEIDIRARADILGYRYETANGLRFKRLWNYSRGVWVDAYWSLA